MKNKNFKFGLILVLFTTIAQFLIAQKVATDITVLYDITVESSNTNPKLANLFNGATNTVYIKGLSNRTESVNALGTSTTIYDGKTKSAVILKEYGNQKILVRLTNANWLEMNKKNDGIVFTKTSETKTIAGYNCTKSIGKFTDGTEFTVYSTNDILPQNKEYNTQFKNTNGLVLQYEYSSKDMKIITTAATVTFNDINNSKFDIPKTGFREMTYEESVSKK